MRTVLFSLMNAYSDASTTRSVHLTYSTMHTVRKTLNNFQNVLSTGFELLHIKVN